MDWLMNGKDEMFVSSSPDSSQIETNEVGSPTVSSPVSGIPIQPGFINQLSASQQMPPQTSNFSMEGKIFDKPSRKIAEIRVFYDDGTFETFYAK